MTATRQSATASGQPAEEQEAAEKRRSHLETVERLKRQGFTDKTMQDWTFANDNGSCRR